MGNKQQDKKQEIFKDAIFLSFFSENTKMCWLKANISNDQTLIIRTFSEKRHRGMVSNFQGTRLVKVGRILRKYLLEIKKVHMNNLKCLFKKIFREVKFRWYLKKNLYYGK